MKKELYDSEYYTRGAKNLLLYPIGQLMDWINLALFEKRFPAGGRILEIGCGDGKVSRWMSSRGFEVEAIDIKELMTTIIKTFFSFKSKFIRNLKRIDIIKNSEESYLRQINQFLEKTLRNQSHRYNTFLQYYL